MPLDDAATISDFGDIGAPASGSFARVEARLQIACIADELAAHPNDP